MHESMVIVVTGVLEKRRLSGSEGVD